MVPLHFLIVTRHWEHQTAPLTPPQLTAAYQLLTLFANTLPHATAKSATLPPAVGTAANPVVGGELLCFFNCGDASGASQEHKHLQFAPMTGEGSIGFFPTERAAQAVHFEHASDAQKPFSIESLPYAHHIRKLDPPPCPAPERASPEQLIPLMRYLQEAYLSLLDAMMDDLRLLHDSDPAAVPAEKMRLGRGLSYNLLMTRKHMQIIPRREAIFRIEEHGHQSQPNTLSDPELNGPSSASGKAITEPALIGCNSLAYTGTVLVKSSDDARRLVKQGGVLEALKHCGYAKSARSMPSISHD